MALDKQQAIKLLQATSFVDGDHRLSLEFATNSEVAPGKDYRDVAYPNPYEVLGSQLSDMGITIGNLLEMTANMAADIKPQVQPRAMGLGGHVGKMYFSKDALEKAAGMSWETAQSRKPAAARPAAGMAKVA